MNIPEQVYVLRFSTGTVKVGRSKSFDRRLKDHEKNARAHGISVTDVWHAMAEHPEAAEAALMRLAELAGGCPVPGNREFFVGANFQVLEGAAMAHFGDYDSQVEAASAKAAARYELLTRWIPAPQ